MRVIDAAHLDTLHTVYLPCLGDDQLFHEAENLSNIKNIFSLPTKKKIDKKNNENLVASMKELTTEL